MCRLDIRSIAVSVDDTDVRARHMLEVDAAVRLGPPAAQESYLDVDRVIEAAVRSGSREVHSG
ncbi:biotin carboxylase N-terminal domain-containing protein [Mycobacterium leprae]|uniref:biotin carboxylase N-terminal domain-containing protein n=1 Tax=Mycobacterium leprae TaxID=1769 RepID=UPI000A9D8068|nr:biotin carboxylase N-terminal domain-containing protein [Mycobacterium leprae]